MEEGGCPALANAGVRQTLLVCPGTGEWGLEFGCQNVSESMRNQ